MILFKSILLEAIENILEGKKRPLKLTRKQKARGLNPSMLRKKRRKDFLRRRKRKHKIKRRMKPARKAKMLRSRRRNKNRAIV